MDFCYNILYLSLLSFFQFTVSDSKTLSVNSHLLNSDSGNREKFTIEISKSTFEEEEQVFDHPLKSEIARRFRRAVATTTPGKTQFSFNDSHYIAEVHWSGMNSSSIMVLMKNPTAYMRSNTPSSFWVSRNYGKTFTEISKNFTLPNGTRAVITEFYSSKVNHEYYILVDKFHKYIYSSTDECRTFRRVRVYFYPVEIKYHPYYYNYVLAYEKDMGNKQLYVSSSNGRYWRYKSSNVKAYYWGYSKQFHNYYTYFYYLRSSWYGYGNIVKRSSPWSYYYQTTLAYNVEDFELVNQYMFITKNVTGSPNNASKELFVSYMRGDFENTSFPFNYSHNSFIIADATENETMIAINHNGTANLYISNREGTKYSLSLENVLYYNDDDGKRSYFRHDFVDLHRVQGISGIYIATQLDGNIPGKRHLQSVITFDKGGYWSKIRAPSADKNCTSSSKCSLHLSNEFGYHHPGLHFSPILSKASAPGFIIGTGNVGKNLKNKANVYFSKDAGLSWKKLFEGHYYYNFVDHGGVLLAVEKYGLVETFKYSYDEGETWHSYKFTENNERFRVYGILTEPGEKSTVFTIYASYGGSHSWEILEIDMKPILSKPCKKDSDYYQWIVTDQRNDTEKCVLGKKQVFERRKAKSVCLNGINYDRPIRVEPCECQREDFKCDYGFKEAWIGWYEWGCIHDNDYEDYSQKAPSWCKPGLTYNVSSGYVKVPGDACYGGDEEKYEPRFMVCPIPKTDDFLLYATRNVFWGYDLKTKKSVEFKIDGYANIVALEVAYDKRILFFADKDRDDIVMINATGGNITVLLGFDSSSVHIESLAYDWIGGNLYYCDSGKAIIGIINVEGKHKKELIGASVLDKPRAMIVHPTKGYLFWTDWGEDPKIQRATMDGKNIKNIVTTNIHWPNGLTIDYDTDTLYFADAYKNRIDQCDLDGGDRKIVISEGISHPFAVTFYNGYLYWDDSYMHSVYKIQKNGNGNKETVISYINYAMDIKAFSKSTQKKGTNDCFDSNSKSKCDFICLPVGAKNHSCVCPDFLEMRGGTCKCPLGERLHNNECHPVNSTTCLETQFTCINGDCIPQHWKCDQEEDCTDGSDEGPEICSTCNVNQFTCGDGRCIISSYKCDNETDCMDGTDEANCTSTDHIKCPSGKVKCPRSGRCIDSTWLCDDEDDCGDNWDENVSNCPHKSTTAAPRTTYKPCNKKNEFQCKSNGRCITKSWHCDNYRDCSDGSDERHCGKKKCADHEFTCDNNTLCYLKREKCDGIYDCVDGSDEEGCSTRKPDVTVFTCERGLVYCADNKGCYEKSGRCDGSLDCRDHSDEKNCDGIIHTTLKPRCDYRCNNGKCIDNDKKCNGVKDCDEGEDESRKTCDESKTYCLPYPFGFNCTKNVDGICHPYGIVCNGHFDCQDNSDESSEICKTTKRVQQLTAKLQGLTVHLEWEAPQLFLSDLKEYKISYIDDNGVQKSISKKLGATYHDILLQACRKYTFAVAIIHKDLSDDKQLYTTTRQIETGGKKIQPPKIVSKDKGNLIWREDKGDCADSYLVIRRYLECYKPGNSENKSKIAIAGPNVMLDFKKNKLFNDNVNYKCSVVIVYLSMAPDGGNLTRTSESFDINSPQAKASKKRNTLVWAIPVALVVIALVVGLLLMAYKYRRLQNSFLAFAARGGYSRQMDDYADDDDDDNMGVAFHAGEDAPMINRFSDDEPLVVG